MHHVETAEGVRLMDDLEPATVSLVKEDGEVEPVDIGESLFRAKIEGRVKESAMSLICAKVTKQQGKGLKRESETIGTPIGQKFHIARMSLQVHLDPHRTLFLLIPQMSFFLDTHASRPVVSILREKRFLRLRMWKNHTYSSMSILHSGLVNCSSPFVD